MARGRAADYDDRRGVLADTAARLFAERGFAAVSMNDIAKACGCAKSLLYHYFPSKEQLIADLLTGHVEALLAEAKQALASSDDPRQQLRAFLRGHMRLYADARAYHILLLNSLTDVPPEQRRAVTGIERELIDMATALLVRLVPGLAERPELRRPAAMNLYALINWTHIWYDASGPVKPDAFADFAGDMILDGLAVAVSRASPPGSPLPLSGLVRGVPPHQGTG